MKVTDGELDRQRHDRYLDVIIAHTDPLNRVMTAMGRAAGTAARSGVPADYTSAAQAMGEMKDQAGVFLDALAATDCPYYLRGADGQLQDAIKLWIDGGRRGADAARAHDGARLIAAAGEMEVATRDVVVAAQQITNWKAGAARP